MLFRKNATIVFQGDSVTDAGRTRGENDGLGHGYPAMCAGVLKNLFPDYELTIYNRGIGGNRVENLVDRWQTDTIDLRPNLVSILIGVNNVWHPYTHPEISYDIRKFEADYTRIVEQTIHYGAKLIVMEPFAFHNPEGCFPESWRERLWEVNQVARRIALRYADAYIPLDGILYQEAMKATPTVLSVDGVHPTFEGHRVLAREWLKAAGVI
jgi:lysophospholipase L1-like esterase